MAWHIDLSVQFLSACNRRVEVVEFKPQEHAVSVWCDVGISDAGMMMLHIPSVQLKNQPAMRNEPLVIGPAMGALAPKETLIPATARLDIGHANKWLWIHTTLVASDRDGRSRGLKDKAFESPILLSSCLILEANDAEI